MVNFSYPASFNKDEVEAIVNLNAKFKNKLIRVKTFYGCLNPSVWPSARSPFNLPSVSPRKLKGYLTYLHKLGFVFEYTLNSPFMHGFETDPKKKNELIDFIKMIFGLGVDELSVSSLSLMDIVTRKFRDHKLNISTVANIKNSAQLAQLRDYKINMLTPSIDVNREVPNLKRLLKLSKKMGLEIKLIVNSDCLYNCAFNKDHYYFVGLFNKSRFFDRDYFKRECIRKMITDVDYILTSPCIRPEDLEFYRDLGVKSFKLNGRVRSREDNLFFLQTYMKGKFKGNFFSLWSGSDKSFWARLYYLNNRDLDGLSLYLANKFKYNGWLKEMKSRVRRRKIDPLNLASLDKTLILEACDDIRTDARNQE